MAAVLDGDVCPSTSISPKDVKPPYQGGTGFPGWRFAVGASEQCVIRKLRLLK